MTVGMGGERPDLTKEAITHFSVCASTGEDTQLLPGPLASQVCGGFLWGHDPTRSLRVLEEAKLLYTKGHSIRWLWAVDFNGDEVAALLRNKVNAGAMDVVHIMGQGSANGVDICVPCDEPTIAAPDFINALTDWSSPRQIRLGVFNLCHSRAAATTAARRWGFAVGTEGLVHPKSAVFFADRFYAELAAKQRDVTLAFRATIWAMKTEGAPIKQDAELYRLFPSD